MPGFSAGWCSLNCNRRAHRRWWRRFPLRPTAAELDGEAKRRAAELARTAAAVTEREVIGQYAEVAGHGAFDFRRGGAARFHGRAKAGGTAAGCHESLVKPFLISSTSGQGLKSRFSVSSTPHFSGWPPAALVWRSLTMPSGSASRPSRRRLGGLANSSMSPPEVARKRQRLAPISSCLAPVSGMFCAVVCRLPLMRARLTSRSPLMVNPRFGTTRLAMTARSQLSGLERGLV